ncbi:unnamed protein product [Brassica rapa subsp. trilocularis]
MNYFFKKSYLETKPVLDQVPTKAGSDVASPSQSLTIAVALSGSTKSKNVLKWALRKFSSDKNVIFKLIHVHPKITSVPTPSGKTVYMSEAPEDVVATYRRKTMEDTKETLLKPYRKMNRDVTAKIPAYVSDLCTVYVVSKGVYILTKDKLSSDGEINETILRDIGSERIDTSSYSSSLGHISDATLKSKSLAMSNHKRLEHLPTIVRGVSVHMETSSVDSYGTTSMSSGAAEKASSSLETSRSISWNITQSEDYFTGKQVRYHYKFLRPFFEIESILKSYNLRSTQQRR